MVGSSYQSLHSKRLPKKTDSGGEIYYLLKYMKKHWKRYSKYKM